MPRIPKRTLSFGELQDNARKLELYRRKPAKAKQAALNNPRSVLRSKDQWGNDGETIKKIGQEF